MSSNILIPPLQKPFLYLLNLNYQIKPQDNNLVLYQY